MVYRFQHAVSVARPETKTYGANTAKLAMLLVPPPTAARPFEHQCHRPGGVWTGGSLLQKGPVIGLWQAVHSIEGGAVGIDTNARLRCPPGQLSDLVQGAVRHQRLCHGKKQRVTFALEHGIDFGEPFQQRGCHFTVATGSAEKDFQPRLA